MTQADAAAPAGERGFVRRAAIALGLGALFATGFLLIAYAPSAVLLTFAAVWFGCVIHHASAVLSRATRLPGRWAMGVVVALVVGLAVGFAALFVWQLSGQVGQLYQSLTESVAQLKERVAQYPALRSLVAKAPSPAEAAKAVGGSGSLVTDLFMTPLGLVVNVLFVFFTGLYLAGNPELYAGGFARLFPRPRRAAVRAVLTECGAALWGWTLARLFSMALVGVLSGVGLALLGVPMAATLGVATALFVFVPNVGPVLALVPPLLLSLSQGGWMPVYVVALYVGIELFESYVVTPIIHEREDALPAAVVIVSQLLFAVLFGLLGVTFAMPIALVAMIWAQRFYVDQSLEGRDARVEAETSERVAGGTAAGS